MKTPVAICLLLLLAVRVFAQERIASAWTDEAGIISGNQLFYVNGTNRAELLEIALWAEDVAGRISTALERPYPRRAGQTLLRIELLYDDTRPVAVETQQYDSDAGFRQVLMLWNVTRNEQAGALRALCRLILTRYALAEVSGAAPGVKEEPPVPDWMVDGLVMQWLPVQRAAGREALLREWEAGETFSVERILEDGWEEPLRSAVAGEWCKWLLERPDASALFRAVLARCGTGEAITAEWLVGRFPVPSTLRGWNQAWSLHLAMLPGGIVLPGALFAEDVERLRDSLVIYPEMISVAVQEDIPYTYSLNDMIEARRAAWMPALVSAVAARIQEASLGRAPELQETARKYLDYLDAVSQRRGGWWSGGVSDAELNNLLEEADHSMRELIEKMQTGQAAADSVTDE